MVWKMSESEIGKMLQKKMDKNTWLKSIWRNGGRRPRQIRMHLAHDNMYLMPAFCQPIGQRGRNFLPSLEEQVLMQYDDLHLYVPFHSNINCRLASPFTVFRLSDMGQTPPKAIEKPCDQDCRNDIDYTRQIHIYHDKPSADIVLHDTMHEI